MRELRPSPRASRIERTTVFLPEPVPPATPKMQGFRPEGSSSGWSEATGPTASIASIAGWRTVRGGRTGETGTPGFYRRVGGTPAALAGRAGERAAPGPHHAAAEGAAAGAGGAFAALGGGRPPELPPGPLALGGVLV